MKNFLSKEWLVLIGIGAMILVTLLVILAPWAAMTAGDIPTEYGSRLGPGYRSVNGTSVFAEMFSQRGGSISTWSRLSPRLKRSDVIVWMPNSFELPNSATTKYFEDEWLSLDDVHYRTLIYVARDFDAAVEYWKQQSTQSTGRTYLESRSQAARTQSDHALSRSWTALELKSEWFSIESNQSFVDADINEGEWIDDLKKQSNGQPIQLPVAGTLNWKEPKKNSGRKYEILLGSEGTPLIVRMTDDYAWPDGQVLIVLNGSSLLNLPLVEHENRLIASKLIDECGEDVGRVTFLETGPSGVSISTSDPRAYSGFDALKIWPINSVLLHLIVAGILFCAMVFPIFGRPHDLENDSPSNFGKHIQAMGELFAITQDKKTALAKVQQYRNLKIEPLLVEPSETEEAGNPFQVSKI